MSPPVALGERSAVEISLITFIPMPSVTDPLGVRYEADGPGFSYERNRYRTRHTLVIDPTRVTPSDHLSGRSGLGATRLPPGFVKADDPRTGLSVSFFPTVILPGGIRPILPRIVLEEARADTLASMRWYFRRAADGSFRITMAADATNPVAVSRYFGIVPAINYSVEFAFSPDRRVTVSGSHDGFPAYDFYFQGRHFHRYDPIAVGADPLALFGTSDIPFDRQRLP
jgi:Protein of unknown function (DUF3238)